MTEPKFKFTTKIDGDLFTVHGDSLQEFQANLDAASQSGIGANIRNMVTSVNNTGALNQVLGAMPVDPAQNPSQGQPATAEPTPDNPWGQTNQQAPGGWAPPQGQQQGGSNNWGQPPQDQQQGGWGQPQQQAQQPPQGGGAPAGVQPPTNPLTGQPMKYKEGVSKKTGKPYRMWTDERDWSVLKNLPEEQKAKPVFFS